MIFPLILGQSAVGFEPLKLRDYKPINLAKGTFLKVVSKRELSTKLLREGDEILMISPCDVYLEESNIIPEGSLFTGYVAEIREPVQGTNAAMKIIMTKITLPDGMQYKIQGYITHSEKDYLGGEMTAPMYYDRVPHYTTHFKGVTQWAPTQVYFWGEHTVIKPGEELFLVLTDKVNIYSQE